MNDLVFLVCVMGLLQAAYVFLRCFEIGLRKEVPTVVSVLVGVIVLVAIGAALIFGIMAAMSFEGAG